MTVPVNEVFLCYMREDENRAANLTKALEVEGFLVLKGRANPREESWEDHIQAALDAARCVIVIWTKESTGPKGDRLRSEVRRSKERGVLVPVMMQKTRLPAGFENMQYVDLNGWKGGRGNIFFKDLSAACRATIDGTSLPKQKGQLHRKLVRIGLSAAPLIVLAYGFIANFASVQNQVCSINWVQPSLSDMCGKFGLGDKPTRTERLAWENLPLDDCNALRNHVENFPEGVYRDDAADMISARRISQNEVWSLRETLLRLFVGQDSGSNPDHVAAEAAALSRAQTKAAMLCQDFAVTSTYRYIGASAVKMEWDCETYPSGTVCSGVGKAMCQVEARSIVETERCGAANMPD